MTRSARGIERMTGADAGFLYMETPSMHMHTLKIAILEPDEGLTYASFCDGVLGRIAKMPPLRRKVVPVPFMLNHPVWVTLRRIDPARHFVRHDLRDTDPTGSRAGLERLIGEIASTSLDRRVPLWELHYVEGLDDGSVCIVGKLHHALADGMAANALLGNVTEDGAGNPTGDDDPAPEPAVVAEEDPTPGALVRAGLVDAIRQIALIPALVWRTIRGISNVVRYRRAEKPDVPRPVLDAPRVSFNGPLTRRRLYATTHLPLADLKAARRDGATLNDVVLALVGGALRRWMEQRGEQPSSTLLAGVPTSTDPAPRLSGNKTSNLFTSLGTDIADAGERLRAISQVTKHSKQIQQELGPDMLNDWVQFTPPGPFSAIMRLYSKVRAAKWHAAPFNVIVSNVPGPRRPATIGTARLTELFSVGPILEGMGLNITVWSYVDQMNFSLLTCPSLISDLTPLVAQFRPALDELLAAT